jgi:hypothetical protein
VSKPFPRSDTERAGEIRHRQSRDSIFPVGDVIARGCPADPAGMILASIRRKPHHGGVFFTQDDE